MYGLLCILFLVVGGFWCSPFCGCCVLVLLPIELSLLAYFNGAVDRFLSKFHIPLIVSVYAVMPVVLLLSIIANEPFLNFILSQYVASVLIMTHAVFASPIINTSH